MYLSQKLLRQILGVLWLIDGLLQLQPEMFTMNMVNKVLNPIASGQPAPIAASLQWITSMITAHLAAANIVIAIVQITIGVLLITGFWVRVTVIASIFWALLVWYGGEGMSMLFAGQGSALTGAPGAVLLYPLLGLLVYPRKGDPEEGLVLRSTFRWILAGTWFFFALLQLQPYWWQGGQISGAIGGMVGMGGLDNSLVDGPLQHLSTLIANGETILNVALIVIFLALGIATLVARKPEQQRPVLIASIIVSLVFWYTTEALGGILTGMATDFNSGLLIVLMVLACWPKPSRQSATQEQATGDTGQTESTVRAG